MEAPILRQAPALDPAWLQFEVEADLLAPKPTVGPLERQPIYAAKCRELNSAMMAPGARDHHLSHGIFTRYISVPSSQDGFAIPVLQYDQEPARNEDRALDERAGVDPKFVVVYYHGGGLLVGEADSEDLSCRRILKDSGLSDLRLYSVGYRLKAQHAASTCISDSMDAFNFTKRLHSNAKIILVGSSSGGELAAFVSQYAPKESFHGVVLRCPVTSDAFSGIEYVPERLRGLHTSALNRSFHTSILGFMARELPRDGLERMPLEGSEEELEGMPRTWIQVCTNDVLYSDGICYAKILKDAGVEVEIDVVQGWPHTFWLKAPQLSRALLADQAMLKGLAWVAGLDG